jgi:hypothetical protein
MSTRGAIGFRINGQDKLTYNHSDSYPGGLGVEFVAMVRELVKDKDLKNKVEKLVVVNGNTPPTDEQITQLAPWTSTSVGGQSTSDWYCLLRNAQGQLDQFLEAGYILDGNEFIKDSLFCEYAYILNLDRGVVEFYKGFQEKEHGLGRYGKARIDYAKPGEKPRFSDYYGCALVGVFPMTNIPDDWEEQVFPVDTDEES